MSRQDSLHEDLHLLPSTATPAAYSNIARFILFAVLLYISATTFEFWPDTTKRFLWECLIRFTPSRLIYLTESRLSTGDQSWRFGMAAYEDSEAKSAALERIFGPDGIPLLANLRRARSFPIPLLHKNLKPPGLGNWDNSCYQNSMLQGLSSLAFFRKYIHDHLTSEPEKASMQIHIALNNIMSKLNNENNNGRTLWPTPALKSMNSWQQQDAQEYLSKLITEVDRETSSWRKKQGLLPGLSILSGKCQSDSSKILDNSCPSTAADSIFLNPLEGLLAQRVGCLRCGYCEGLSMIPFNCLTLSLGESQLEYDVKDCLDDYTALEQIDGVECAKCTLVQAKAKVECCRREIENGEFNDPTMYKTWADATLGVINKALAEEDFSENMLKNQCQISPKNRTLSTKSKQIVIARPPQSLIIHINRSKFDEMTGAQLKNYRPLRFQTTLDLSKWLLGANGEESNMERWTMDTTKSMLAPTQGTIAEASKTYELRAVVTHYGRHENGHYVAYKKHRFQKAGPKGQLDVDDVSGPDSYAEPWYEFSDADVTDISEETLLCHDGVFMLFYEAISVDAEVDKVDDEERGITSIDPQNEVLDVKDPCRLVADPIKSTNEGVHILPTPSPTPQPDMPISYKSILEQNISPSATLHRNAELTISPSVDVPRITTPSDESSSEASDPDDLKCSCNRSVNQKRRLGGSAYNISMRTAGDANLSRSHSGKSSDSFSLTPPSLVSAV